MLLEIRKYGYKLRRKDFWQWFISRASNRDFLSFQKDVNSSKSGKGFNRITFKIIGRINFFERPAVFFKSS